MKRIFFAIPVILLCAVPACKKAKGPASGTSVQVNNRLDSTVHVDAMINGVEWKTDSAYGYTVKHSGNDSGLSNLLIEATNKQSDPASSIKFYITNYSGPDTYKVEPPINTATYYSGSNRYYGTKGQIIVATDTAHALRGSFNFTAGTITVSAGVFDVAKP